MITTTINCTPLSPLYIVHYTDPACLNFDLYKIRHGERLCAYLGRHDYKSLPVSSLGKHVAHVPCDLEFTINHEEN